MIIDFATNVGHWPFRKYRKKNVSDLLETMNQYDIDRSVSSHIHAVFYEDVHEANVELFEAIKDRPRIIGAAVLTPEIPAWPRQLDEAAENLGLRAVKLYPTYHAYDLLSEKALDLARAVLQKGLPLIVQVRIEDRRRHHPKMQVDDLPIDTVREFLKREKKGKVVVAGILQNEALTLRDILENRGETWIDLSFCESMGGVNQLVDALGADRLLFASHFPFLYTKAALLKIESAQLSQTEQSAILHRNAEQILGL